MSAGERAAVAAVSERYRGDNVFRGERATANGSRPIASCGSDNLRNFRQTQGEREMDASGGATRIRSGPIVTVLLAISFSHLLNDTIQAVIPAIYPLLKKSFELTFGQVGLITLTFQLTASVLQPLVGLYADARPAPYSLTIGMGFTLAGITLMSFAGTFPLVLLAGRAGGDGVVHFSPGSLPSCPFGIGGKTWLGAIALPSRRQRRDFVWAAADRGDHRPSRASVCPVVRACGAGRHRRALLGGGMVSPEINRGGELDKAHSWRCRHDSSCAGRSDSRVSGPAGPHILEVFLSREHDELLHLLPYSQVPRLCSGLAGVSLYFPFLGGGRDDSWRADR